MNDISIGDVIRVWNLVDVPVIFLGHCRLGLASAQKFKLSIIMTFTSPDAHQLASLPGDLLLEIAGFLFSKSDILHFSLSSSSIYSNVASALYTSVTLDTLQQCIRTLSMLHKRPEIARHVQHLLVRPNGGRRRSRRWIHDLTDGYAVAAAVRQVARNLDALNSFVWDADDGMPPHDDMWFALRISCPQLKSLGTSVGSSDQFFFYVSSLNLRTLLGSPLLSKRLITTSPIRMMMMMMMERSP